MRRNVLVALSGGPSPVINASLQGVFDACLDFPDRIGKIFAGWHGMEGILKEELIDLSAQPRREIELLRYTPASGAVGTSRYKMPETGQEEDFDRLIRVMEAHDIGFFFYIGGNDSMNTAHVVSRIAEKRKLDITVTGVPKTIDNDLGDPEFKMLDHTPGYGSTARYWACLMQNLNEENRGMSPSEPVAVMQAMGRKAGFIPAAVRLADPDRRMPIQLYLTEGRHTLESMAENVNRQLAKTGRCIVVVSEGFDVGGLGEKHDGYGNIEYGASRSTVAQVVVNYLNDGRLKHRGQATGQLPGVLQRSTSIYSSNLDIREAYEVGRKAVSVGIREGSGWMANILRKPGGEYEACYDKVRLDEIARTLRMLPASWLSKDELDVTDDFIRYARPLIGDGWPEIAMEGGLQRFARLSIEFVPAKLPAYVPLRYRE